MVSRFFYDDMESYSCDDVIGRGSILILSGGLVDRCMSLAKGIRASMAASPSSSSTVHLVLFPYPTQGHINPMMELARRLIQRSPDIHVTFINTHHNQERILANGSGGAWPSDAAPNLRFVLVPDGLPAGHGRLSESVREFTESVDEKMRGPLEEALRGIMATSASPVACIVSDTLCAWVQAVADRVGLPRVTLWTTPAHASVVYCSHALLQSQRLIPFKGKEGRSELVTSMAGVVPLRLSELISFFEDDEDWLFNWCASQFAGDEPAKAAMNLGNNIYELEKDAVHAFQCHVRSFLPIGPLFSTFYIDSSSSTSTALACHASTSLWPEDRSCGTWLDGQARGSVVYVSFGSIVQMEAHQVREIALGLEASPQPFLWVFRSTVDDPATRSFLDSFQQRTRHRSLIVSWAPQLLVLSHPSTAAFLTHCGWNSLTEAMYAGLPILAFPGAFGEQNMNARYVVDVWKTGLQIKRPDSHHVVTHEEISTTITTLMSSPIGDQVKQRAKEVALLARNALSKGGSSDQNLDVFIKAVKNLAQAH